MVGTRGGRYFIYRPSLGSLSRRTTAASRPFLARSPHFRVLEASWRSGRAPGERDRPRRRPSPSPQPARPSASETRGVRRCKLWPGGEAAGSCSWRGRFDSILAAAVARISRRICSESLANSMSLALCSACFEFWHNIGCYGCTEEEDARVRRRCVKHIFASSADLQQQRVVTMHHLHCSFITANKAKSLCSIISRPCLQLFVPNAGQSKHAHVRGARETR